MQFLSRAIWVTSSNSLSTYATCLLIELCQIVVTLCENHFIRPWSRSRTRPPTCYTFNTWKIASTSIHPSTNKTPCCTIFISLQSYLHDVWAIKKEMKDAYPKKVCHMPTRHVKKKEREKMHTQRRYATHPQGVSKKRERKRKYSPYQKHYKGKRIHIKEFSSIIHQKYPHTCTSWSRLMTCFSFGSGLWLSEI